MAAKKKAPKQEDTAETTASGRKKPVAKSPSVRPAAAPVAAAAAKKRTTTKKTTTKRTRAQVVAESNVPAPATAAITPDIVARAAYLNYRNRVDLGLPGDMQSDWLEAERQLGLIP